jgi:hypothetical protein
MIGTSFPTLEGLLPRETNYETFEATQCVHESQTIGLFNQSNLSVCRWPENHEGSYAKSLLSPLIERGTEQYIKNVKTELFALTLGESVIPVTVNEKEYNNSYVCSPYNYYISYALEALDQLAAGWKRKVLERLLNGLGKILHTCDVNKVVIANNWLYSTNLYSSTLGPDQLREIAEFLQHRFPDHAIIFRSVDPYTSSACHQTLSQLGFDYISNRQIYFIEPWKSSLFDSRLFKSDLKLLHNSGYEIIDSSDLASSDVPRLLDLYNDLFIIKHSTINPQFTQSYVELMLNQRLMHFKALRKEGKIDGVIGFIERNGMMFAPFFGYDRTVSKETGLYRLLSTVLMLESNERKLLFHQSSGASTFKKIRKANAAIESLAVYHQHLSFKRRLPWTLLKQVCNTMGVHYMEQY